MRSAPSAVVLGLNPNGIGVMKSLRAGGIRVAGLDRASGGWANTHTWMSSRTRLCHPKVLLDPKATWSAYLSALEQLGRSLGGRPTLFPSGDAELELISAHRDRLEPLFRFSVPPAEVVDHLLNKGRFYESCAEWGVPAPGTLVHPSVDDVRAQGSTLRFPLLIKPDIRDAVWNARYGNTKAIECPDETALVTELRAATDAGLKVLVQEVVPGADDQLFFSHGYVGSDGRLLALWTGRKLRQHPLRFGTSTLVESTWRPRVAAHSLRLVEALDLRGYFSVEFKWDERDDSYRVMELTPGRTWYPHLLGVALGINIPVLWHRDLMGERPAPVSVADTPEGIRWVDEYRDVIAAVESVALGRLSVGAWLSSYRGVRSLALASVSDPVPFALVLVRMARSFLNQLVLRGGRELTTTPPSAGSMPGAASGPRPRAG